MSRLLWPLLVFLICLAVAVLAMGVPLPFLDSSSITARPRSVPDGDQELAWLHTTTNGSTWERFVVGIQQARHLVPGLEIDDSAAFIDRTIAVPEVVLGRTGRAGKLRIRWYKLSNDTPAEYWVRTLAERDPAPLALIGGGSSDRAVDLARSLEAQTTWQGERPLLFLTTATADEIQSPTDVETTTPLAPRTNLVNVYQDRTFRFCFTNRQMAEAVLDFVWETPQLRPESFGLLARQALLSGLGVPPPNRRPQSERPHVFTVFWRDDPYSTDLYWQFNQTLSRKLGPAGLDIGGAGESPVANFSTWAVNYSVGGFSRPNRSEARVVEDLLRELQSLPPQRSLLVLPTVTQPGRRFLRTLAESAPQLAARLVAVTGDGIPVNSLYRDGEFAWPVHAMPVPLVLFSHNNPFGWDEAELRPPTSTDDVLHFAELIRVVSESAFPGETDGPSDTPTTLAQELRNRCPTFFDEAGNRLDGTGEFIAVLWPPVIPGSGVTRIDPQARIEVYQRGSGRSWDLVRAVDLQSSRFARGARRE